MKLLATALAVAGLVMGALPAEANTAALATTLLVNSEALDAVKQAGFLVLVDSHTCRQKTYLYGLTETGTRYGNLLHICLAQHGKDTEELEDTIRHESLHVAQYCKRGLLLPVSVISKQADRGEVAALSSYPADQKHSELEARVLARGLNDQGVARVVTKACR